MDYFAANNSLEERLQTIYYPTWAAVSVIIIGITGVLGNALILVTIFTEKSLRSRCHVLMAAFAASNMINCIYSIHNRIHILAGYLYLNNFHCFCIGIYGLCAENFESALELAIGVDRFLAVFSPTSYLTWPSIPYLVAMLIPSLTFAVALTAYGFAQADSTIITMYCFPPTAYNGSSWTAWISSNGFIVILVICVYSATTSLLRRSNHASTVASKRIIGSLQIVIGLYSVTWALTILANFLIKNIGISQDWTNWAGLLVVVNSSSNFAIYAWRSTDFRAAFAKILRLQSTSKVEPLRIPPNQE